MSSTIRPTPDNQCIWKQRDGDFSLSVDLLERVANPAAPGSTQEQQDYAACRLHVDDIVLDDVTSNAAKTEIRHDGQIHLSEFV